jgi:hypothetical protein
MWERWVVGTIDKNMDESSTWRRHSIMLGLDSEDGTGMKRRKDAPTTSRQV